MDLRRNRRNRQLAQIRDPDGVVAFSATYATDHRILTRTVRGSGTYGYAYDAAGLVVADTLPAVSVDGGAAERLVARQRPWESLFLGGLSPAARVTTSRTAARAAFFSPRGDSTRVNLDRFGLPLRVETPHGKYAEYRRNRYGQVEEEWTELGSWLAYSWTGPAMTGYTDPTTGLWVTVDYRPDHQPRLVEYGEYVINYEYDAAGHLLKTRAGQDSTVYTYTADHRVQSVRDEAGRLTTFTYQQPGEGTGFRNLRRVEEPDPATGGWRQTDYEIDNAGRAVAVTLNDLTSRVRPDALNRDTASTDPLGRTVRTSYPERHYGGGDRRRGKAVPLHPKARPAKTNERATVVLGVLHNGRLYVTSNITLSHQAFAQRLFGSLPAGAEAFTFGKSATGAIWANTSSYYNAGRMRVASEAVLQALARAFR